MIQIEPMVNYKFSKPKFCIGYQIKEYGKYMYFLHSNMLIILSMLGIHHIEQFNKILSIKIAKKDHYNKNDLETIVNALNNLQLSPHYGIFLSEKFFLEHECKFLVHNIGQNNLSFGYIIIILNNNREIIFSTFLNIHKNTVDLSNENSKYITKNLLLIQDYYIYESINYYGLLTKFNGFKSNINVNIIPYSKEMNYEEFKVFLQSVMG